MFDYSKKYRTHFKRVNNGLWLYICPLMLSESVLLIYLPDYFLYSFQDLLVAREMNECGLVQPQRQLCSLLNCCTVCSRLSVCLDRKKEKCRPHAQR